jgi:hypothetical protein
VQDFVEKLFPETITEVSKGTISRGLEEIEATEKAESGIIAKGRAPDLIGGNLT